MNFNENRGNELKLWKDQGGALSKLLVSQLLRAI